MYQFLMGLNEAYIGVMSNLLMLQPFSSLDSVYNILLQDQRQKQIVFPSQFSNEYVSFNVSYDKRPPATKSHINYPILHKPHNAHPPTPYAQRINFDQDKSSLFCKYCKRSEHVIEKCYKIFGYPNDFKFSNTNSKGKKVDASVDIREPTATNTSSLDKFYTEVPDELSFARL